MDEMEFSKKTILVVDDDVGIQETLMGLLELEGYDPVLARDGREALMLLEEKPPSLILLDLVMPRLDGQGFVEELEHRGLRRRFPIIVLSADGRVALKARQIGADDFLPKPFDLDVVLNKVASWTTR
jgi:CheY-like chemotaxis protein